MADYKNTVFLPRTDFPMKAGLAKKEPELLARWDRIGLFGKLRAQSKGREKFILHDGPPYANGNLHIGHALNKILKDVINRSQQMLGKDAQLRAGLGLPRPADRMEDRGGVPRQGQGQGRGADRRVPRRVPRLRRSTGSTCSARSSSASASTATGTIPTPP